MSRPVPIDVGGRFGLVDVSLCSLCHCRQHREQRGLSSLFGGKWENGDLPGDPHPVRLLPDGVFSAMEMRVPSTQPDPGKLEQMLHKKVADERCPDAGGNLVLFRRHLQREHKMRDAEAAAVVSLQISIRLVTVTTAPKESVSDQTGTTTRELLEGNNIALPSPQLAWVK